METEFKVGDVLVNTTPFALSKKIEVTEIKKEYFVARVIEGVNTKTPLTVFRSGWPLYKKENSDDEASRR